LSWTESQREHKTSLRIDLSLVQMFQNKTPAKSLLFFA
jgi:hypothetical protein